MQRRRLLKTACGIAAGAMSLALAGAGTARAQDMTISPRMARGVCLTVDQGNFDRFTRIVLEGCAGEALQLFTYHRRSGQIRVAARPDLCIDVDRSPDPPERLHLVRCNGQDQTMRPWTYDAATGLVRSHEGLCWNVPRANFRQGQGLIASRCAGIMAGQQFAMVDPAAAAAPPMRPQHRPQQPQYPVESDAHRMGAGCPRLGQAMSPPSSAPTTIEFTSRVDRAVTVYWIDFKGHPVDMGGLVDKAPLKFSTYVGHYWIVKDFDGRCYGGLIQARPGVNRVVARP